MFVFAHSFISLITRPTRVSTCNSSLIDNSVTNQLQDTLISGILISDISDQLHFLIMQEISNHENLKKWVKLCHVTTVQIIEIFKSGDIDVTYDIVLNKFTEAYIKAFPFIKKKVKLYSNNHRPWITSDILKSIYRKHFV